MSHDYSKYLDEKKTMNKTLKRIIIIVVLLAFIALIFSAVSKNAKKKAEAAKKMQATALSFAVPVEVVKIAQESVIETLDINGDIDGIEHINLFSDFPGKITRVVVKEGDLVRKGQTLAMINRDVVVQRFEDYPIKSLINGIVGKVYLKHGETVSPASPVISVVNVNHMKCTIQLIEKDLAKIKVGQRAEIVVDSYPDTIFLGRVAEVSPVLDPMSRSAEVIIHINNTLYPKTPLKPGMYAAVKVAIKTHEKSLLVPFSSVLTEDSGKKYIFVADENLHAQKIYVETGVVKNYGNDTSKDKISVTGNVKTGDFVVFMGHQFLNPNTKIRFTFEDKKYEPLADNKNPEGDKAQ